MASTSKEKDSAELKFKPSFISKLIQYHLKQNQSNIKVNPKDISVEMFAELLRLFVVETVERISAQAQSEGVEICQIEHLEKILPQLLLDFS